MKADIAHFVAGYRRLIGETDYTTATLSTSQSWSYDSNGNVLTARDNRNVTTTYVNDALGRVLKEKKGDGLSGPLFLSAQGSGSTGILVLRFSFGPLVPPVLEQLPLDPDERTLGRAEGVSAVKLMLVFRMAFQHQKILIVEHEV